MAVCLGLFSLTEDGIALSAPQSRSAPLHRRAAYREVVNTWRGRLAVACSGGVDSTALLLLAAEARDRGRIEPIICIHVDHLTRPETANEAQIVAESCRVLRVPFVRVAIADCLPPSGTSTEDFLRRSRYVVLSRVISAFGIDGIATGHTFNDQIETILMRILSGSSPIAAAGMTVEQDLVFDEARVRVVRPLLSTARDELEEIVSQTMLTCVDDPSNLDVSYRRNRLRTRVIPEIAAAFPGFEKALERSVSLARQDAQFLDMLAGDMALEAVTVSGDKAHISRDVLIESHPAVGSRIVRSTIVRLMVGSTREVTQERVESVLRAARGRTGATIELPSGVVATVRRSTVEFERRQ